ncbi:hypothetical protein AYI68_g1743 [Smittium mucronatum]|uniref:Uncharacterized protein n=1 Tax=Smittium mucronatum TaxID=133383 RepID=A0A1R0H4Q9_9FUNG|nr:hypothetical protein AYI68_g1743 [Smittium mucronatum]
MKYHDSGLRFEGSGSEERLISNIFQAEFDKSQEFFGVLDGMIIVSVSITAHIKIQLTGTLNIDEGQANIEGSFFVWIVLKNQLGYPGSICTV